jgi:predicted dehydrogenase
MRHRAAIVGLGQVGLLLDDDAKRSGVWTHFTAYERLAERFELVAACDPDADRCARAARRARSLRCYESLDAMLAAERLDVVSLCTPPDLHLGQIRACTGKVRAVICEKPLGGDFDEASAVVAGCRTAGTVLAVNYYKRFDGVVPRVAGLLRDGGIGEPCSALASYSGPIEAVGSHALDLLGFLVGSLRLVHATGVAPDRVAAILTFGRGHRAVLRCTGRREDLIFEVEVTGTEGRVRILDNCARGEVCRFRPSLRYGGYRELVPEAWPDHCHAERFLPLFAEVASALDGGRTPLTSDGFTALETQQLLHRIAHDARD